MSTQQGRKYRNRTQDQRKATRRSQFIESAIVVFAKSGYKSAKVTEICREAALTERYFYESFRNKEELMLECYSHATTHLYNKLLEVLKVEESEQVSPVELVEEGISCYFHWCNDRPNYAKLILHEILGINPNVDDIYMRRTAEFAQLIMQMAHRAVPGFNADESDEEVLGISLAGMVVQSAAYWILHNRSIPIEKMILNTQRIFKASITALEQ